MSRDITFAIIEHYGAFNDEGSSWSKEVNLVSWNGGDPKIDIRSWNEDHTKSSKIGTLTKQEATKLADILGNVTRGM